MMKIIVLAATLNIMLLQYNTKVSHSISAPVSHFREHVAQAVRLHSHIYIKKERFKFTYSDFFIYL